MKIEKLNLGNFAAGRAETALPATPKNFSYFGKKAEVEEAEFTRTDLDSRLQETSKKAQEEGYTKGKEEVMHTVLAVENTTKAAAETLVASLTKFFTDYEEQKNVFMRSMVSVTIAAIKKISEKTIKENSEDVIYQALEKSAAIIAKQPEVIIKAKKISLEKLQARIETLIAGQDFKGTLSFVADESCIDGNCVIQWGESGININAEEIVKQVEEVLSEYLKSI